MMVQQRGKLKQKTRESETCSVCLAPDGLVTDGGLNKLKNIRFSYVGESWREAEIDIELTKDLSKIKGQHSKSKKKKLQSGETGWGLEGNGGAIR